MATTLGCPACGYSDGLTAVEDVDPTDVIDLSAAIRRGDIAEAELCLDRIGALFEGWPELIEQARYSRLSRRAA